MILKIGEFKKPDTAVVGESIGYEKAGWRFIDKIDDLKLSRYTEKDPDGKDYPVLRIQIIKTDNLEYVVMVNNEPVYLLSDEGKNIERIN